MKLKIRGLVFVGFAAAVFAQSASAVVPPSIAYPTNEGTDATAKDNLKKTVTSQLYTDETFQERVTMTDLTNDNGSVTEKATYIPWKYGLGGENAEWTKLEGKPQMDVGQNGTNTVYVQIEHDTKGNDKKHYVAMNENAITAGATGVTGAQQIEAAGAQNATEVEQGRLTTAKAVYDFVTDELDEMGANIQGNTTYHTQKVAVIDATWGAQNGLTAPYHVVNPTGEQLNHIDHWELIVPDSVVAESGTDIWGSNGEGPASADYNDLTTAKAVYDVLTGAVGDGYQRKITTNEASALSSFGSGTDVGEGVMIGYRGTDTNDDSTWYVFGARANGVDANNSANNHLSYLEVYKDTAESRPKFLISIKDGALAETAAAIEAGGTATGATAYLSRDKLTTAKAVFDYVQSITNGQTLPLMPGECEVAGVHCALVSSWVPAESVTDPGTGETTTVPAHTALEWTVMAPGV
ncbi:MAG: hypothetical protein IJL21_02375 [Alphaproteobacteria bacterium]|nr:hypothetical protein [Alphaproteobacteria bacterium]